MDARTTVSVPIPFRSPATSLLNMQSDVAARLLAAVGDVALVIDANGVIRDVAVGDRDLADEGVGDWLDRPFVDVVTGETRNKVVEMLRDASSVEGQRWRHVNHHTASGEVPIRYMAIDSGRDGGTIAIGRDLRASAALQQRLLLAQQSIERDYVRLRQAESRYRLLFDLSSEAVLIIDAATRKIVEANPAAEALAGKVKASLVGQSLQSIVDPAARDTVSALLGAVSAAEDTPPVELHLANGGAACQLSATLFRQGRNSYFLARLAPVGAAGRGGLAVSDVLERVPDAFVVTDEHFIILAQNDAFLTLTGCPRDNDVTGQALGRFLGRPGIDVDLIGAQLKEHGSLRNFTTIVRDRYGTQDDVEVSAVAAPNGGAICYGFTVRIVRPSRDMRLAGIDTPRSVEQLTELVGRVSLKDIVRESTDLIERLCIEAALSYTSDNRASAAEILGLSRQSLYSKLHRFGLVNPAGDDDGKAGVKPR